MNSTMNFQEGLDCIDLSDYNDVYSLYYSVFNSNGENKAGKLIGPSNGK